MRPSLITIPLDLPEVGGIMADVQYFYRPGTPEVRYLRNGDPGYPAEPAEVDIQTVSFEGDDYTHIVMADEKLADKVWQEVCDHETDREGERWAEFAEHMGDLNADL